jgi:hypothetical protein
MLPLAKAEMPRGGVYAKLFWVLKFLVGHSFIKVAPNIFSLRPTHHPNLSQIVSESGPASMMSTHLRKRRVEQGSTYLLTLNGAL